jgi:hypothetical protein
MPMPKSGFSLAIAGPEAAGGPIKLFPLWRRSLKYLFLLSFIA